jgi:hypothetical protein
MISFLSDLLGGWRQVRVYQGYSYQVNRGGQRRVVPIEDYGRRGAIDEDWLKNGEFSDEQVHRRFRNYSLRRQLRRSKLQAAGFAS